MTKRRKVEHGRAGGDPGVVRVVAVDHALEGGLECGAHLPLPPRVSSESTMTTQSESIGFVMI